MILLLYSISKHLLLWVFGCLPYFVFTQIANCNLVIPPFESNNVQVTHFLGVNTEIPDDAGTDNYSMCSDPNYSNVSIDPVVYLGVWVPPNGPMFNPFIYTIQFSRPLISMNFIIFGSDAENFVFETDQANITLESVFACDEIIEGDSIFLGFNSGFQGSGLFTISFDCPVYSFTISGKGGGSGSGFKICSNSIVTPELWGRVSGDTLACGQDSVLFEAFGGIAPFTFSYTLNGGMVQTVLSNDAQIWVPTPASSGIYTYQLLQVEDGADSTAVIACHNAHTIEILPTPTAQFIISPNQGVAPFTLEATNMSQNALSYQWFVNNELLAINCPSGSTCPILISNTGTQQVSLVATNSVGCTDTANATISSFDDFGVVVPNVFTPNNDGVNDFFTINTNQNVRCTYQILNRWGNEILQGKVDILAFQPLVLWKGTEVEDGVYFYKILLETETEAKEISGFIELVR